VGEPLSHPKKLLKKGRSPYGKAAFFFAPLIGLESPLQFDGTRLPAGSAALPGPTSRALPRGFPAAWLIALLSREAVLPLRGSL
jgi:hypothetical protein